MNQYKRSVKTMSDKQQPEYNLPLELLNDFQIRWNARKALEEFGNFISATPGLEQLHNDPNIRPTMHLIGQLLGKDLAQSFAAIVNATGEAITAGASVTLP
jgi:hypothetical protein